MMPRVILFIGILLAGAHAQWTQLTPFAQYQYFGYHHLSDANGQIFTYGSGYHTGVSLDPNIRISGDSSFAGFVTGRNGLTNCNDTLTICERHRAYHNFRFYGHYNGDTTKYSGIPMQCPCWFQTYFRTNALDWSCDSLGSCNWFSLATLLSDPSDSGLAPVVINMDSTYRINAFHVPLTNQGIYEYQADAINDPTGAARMLPNKWHLLQVFLDNDSANGFIEVWADGVHENSSAVHGRHGILANGHANYYGSPAQAFGESWNQDAILAKVLGVPGKRDTTWAKLIYMGLPR